MTAQDTLVPEALEITQADLLSSLQFSLSEQQFGQLERGFHTLVN